MADVKLGSSDPSTFYFGASAVSKLYVGSTEVWSSASETVLDTYTSPGNQWRWRAGSSQWNRLHQGTWSSTSSTTGTYLKLDSGSRIKGEYLMFSASDPGGWPANARVRLTVSPSTGGPPYAVEGTPSGAGDSRWTWRDADGNGLVLTTAQIQAGGSFGWDQSDSFMIELFTP